MSDPQAAQGALELASGVMAFIGGGGAEKAQGVGVNRLGDPAGLEGVSEVSEVTPGGVSGQEAPGDVVAAMIVEGEKKGLLLGAGPPLVDGAVVLPEFAEAGAAEAAMGAGFGSGLGDEVGKVGLGVGLDGGSGFVEVVKAHQLVADELVVGRVLQGEEVAQEGPDVLGPRAVVVPAAGCDFQAGTFFEPASAKGIEAAAADPEGMAGGCGAQAALMKATEGLEKEPRGQAVEDLALFIRAICRA